MLSLMRLCVLWLCCLNSPLVTPGGAPLFAAGLLVKNVPRAEVLTRNSSKADGDPKDIWMPPRATSGHYKDDHDRPSSADDVTGWSVDQDRHQPTDQDLENHSKKKGGGPLSFFFAGLFVVFIGLLPVLLAFVDNHSNTRMAWIEACLLYFWLLGGLYLFTQVLWFQSVHFEAGKLQHLTLEESVYLFAQILTTVGYGDITPALPRGQFFVGFFVLIAIFLIMNMISRMNEIFSEKLIQWGKEKGWLEATPRPGQGSPRGSPVIGSPGSGRRESRSPGGSPLQFAKGADPHNMINRAWHMFIMCATTFVAIALTGAIFFSSVESEKKSFGQGIYMSMITLSTVGFGAFTPVTHPGMVFGAYWMMCGVTSLAAVVGSYATFSQATKDYQSDIKLWDIEHDHH